MALANVLRERANIGHEPQVGDVLVNRRTYTGRAGLCSNSLNALAIATYERKLDTLAGELDGSRATDPASGPGEQDKGHAADSTCANSSMSDLALSGVYDA
jgi:hypothetical protein